MQFLKRHYEKLILTLVLLGLVGAAVWLFIRVGQVRQELDATLSQIETTSSPGVLKLPDFAVYSNALAQASNLPPVTLGRGHPVVNPVRWQVKPDGSLLKIQSGKEVGPEAVVVNKTTPLSLILSLAEARGTPTSQSFQIGIERQTATKASDRNKIQRFLSATTKVTFPLDGPTVTVSLKESKGTFPDASELVLEVVLPDITETITISKDKPWNKVLAYSADLTYGPENREWKNQRVNDTITIAGEAYKIIAISDKQIVLSAPNEKRFPIPYKSAP